MRLLLQDAIYDASILDQSEYPRASYRKLGEFFIFLLMELQPDDIVQLRNKFLFMKPSDGRLEKKVEENDHAGINTKALISKLRIAGKEKRVPGAVESDSDEVLVLADYWAKHSGRLRQPAAYQPKALIPIG